MVILPEFTQVLHYLRLTQKSFPSASFPRRAATLRAKTPVGDPLGALELSGACNGGLIHHFRRPSWTVVVRHHLTQFYFKSLSPQK